MSPSSPTPEPVLRAENLRVVFGSGPDAITAVDGVSFDLVSGRTLALVGESGCGKTVTALALMSLIDPPGRIVSGSVRVAGTEMIGARERDLCLLRGNRVAMVFQEPSTALNPVMRIGAQVAEPITLHRELSQRDAELVAVELLREVGIADAAERANGYPHELSGGMRQRVMIAMALAGEPDLLIADEPTTALDVTIQAQILNLIREIQQQRNMAMLFITHNLSLLETVAHDVAVMYAGRLVERGTVSEVVRAPRHPYTRALWRASLAASSPGEQLHNIEGAVPDSRLSTVACCFYDCCSHRQDRCAEEKPKLDANVACFFPQTTDVVES